MGEGLGASPVRVILMPGYNTAVVRWLAEELVMPEAYRPSEQLRGWHR